MPKFSRKGLNSRKPSTSVLNVMIYFRVNVKWLIWVNTERMCSLVDLNRAFVWSSSENSREKFDCFWLEPCLWTAIPATDCFTMVDLFPCKWLNFDRTMTWFSIPANNYFDRWNESIFLRALFKLLIRTEIFHLISDLHF